MNKFVMFLLFSLSTVFFIFQHLSGFSWDFIVYLLNKDFLFSGSGFFEVGRPPLPSLLMFAGGPVYIVLVSLLGLFAVIKFSSVYRVRPEVFYAFLLSPFVLISGFSVGAEFLSLVLALLVLSFVKSSLAGFFVGLSVLAHYSNLPLVLFLLFNKRSFIVFLLTISPWLLFNFAVFNDPLYSFADQFLKNVVMRDYYIMPVNFFHFLAVVSFALPFFIAGLFKFSRFDFFVVLFAFLRVYSYVSVPFKTERYLFPLAVLVALFSAKSLSRFNYRVFIVPFMVSFFSVPFIFYSLESPAPYVKASSLINESCMVLSSSWPFLNFLGVNAGPAPRQELVSKRLSEGYSIVLFRNVFDPDYVLNESFINSLPVVYVDNDFFIISNESVCLPSFDYNLSYIDELNSTLFELRNESFSFSYLDFIS